MDVLNTIDSLCRSIDMRSLRLFEADRYYEGTQPLTFLSPIQRRALGNRLQSVSANYVKLATDSVAERLTVDGFKIGGESAEPVWAAFQRSGMAQKQKTITLEALVSGQAFALVWVDPAGQPTISVESPREVAVSRDPLTHEIVSAVKRWRGSDGRARVMYFEQDQISEYVGPDVPLAGTVPSTGWSFSRKIANPLGAVPLVEFTNSTRLFDHDGTPEAADIWGLVDALSKVLSDMLVASEATALPRRWATGLAVEEDAEGNAVSPFSEAPGALWQTEDPTAKFGQFSEVDLKGYSGLVDTLLRQIGSIAGLPDNVMGFEGAEPASAEQIRASESSLVSRVYARQTAFTPSWARVAALVQAIQTGGTLSPDVEVIWRSPESRTKAAEADAASKLYASGILPLETIWTSLGYSPEQQSQMRRQMVRQRLDAAPLRLPGETA